MNATANLFTGAATAIFSGETAVGDEERDMHHPTVASLAVLIEHSNDFDWVTEASCADMRVEQLDLFFVEAGKSPTQETMAMCGRCPARVRCLEHAYDNEIAGGYFGGVSPSRRRSLSRQDALAVVIDAA